MRVDTLSVCVCVWMLEGGCSSECGENSLFFSFQPTIRTRPSGAPFPPAPSRDAHLFDDLHARLQRDGAPKRVRSIGFGGGGAQAGPRFRGDLPAK